MSVVSGVTIVRAEDIATRDVVLWVATTIRQNALARKPPLGDEERLGRICSIYRPDVSCVIGVGTILWGDVGVVPPVDAVLRVIRASTAIGRPF